MAYSSRKSKRLVPVLTVEDIMSSKVVWLDENDSLDMVMTLFERCQISCAPVSSSRGGYMGLISKFDLFDKAVMNLILSRGSLDQVQVKEVMSNQPIFVVRVKTPLPEAVQLMLDKQVNYLFVKDTYDQIVGMVSSYDLLKHQLRGLQDQLRGNIDATAKNLLMRDMT